MKTELLKSIEEKINSLDDQDVKGVLYWSEFRDFVKDFKPKGKSIEERKREFYNDLIPYKKVYSGQMLREFYDYWTETSDKSKLLPFEKEKRKRAFDINLRLKRWYRNGKKDDGDKKFEANTKRYSR